MAQKIGFVTPNGENWLENGQWPTAISSSALYTSPSQCLHDILQLLQYYRFYGVRSIREYQCNVADTRRAQEAGNYLQILLIGYVHGAGIYSIGMHNRSKLHDTGYRAGVQEVTQVWGHRGLTELIFMAKFNSCHTPPPFLYQCYRAWQTIDRLSVI